MDELKEAWYALEGHWKIEPSRKRISGDKSYGFMRWTLAPLFRMILRVKIRGIANVPKSGPVILAANHLSHVDPLVVILASRRKTHYLAKDGHFRNFALAAFMRATGQIKTNREAGGSGVLSNAAVVLHANRALGIFPEGTRSKKDQPPYLLPGKTGIARIAASNPDVPIVPIGLMGTREFMTPSKHKIPRLWRAVNISYGKPVTWWEWLGENSSVNDLQALTNKEDHEVISELSGLYRKFTDEFMELIRGQGAP
ncbi:MAG: lysophospholipid acyltransferase family protein [Candidatus Poseidoniaceae archaeon]|jgi:1-acyl-sn-glycerol-3-phosphate acyltransferase|nr:lysophospholipid acyltransferase family protein [Candidatus Poseidoniaceae archaeon]